MKFVRLWSLISYKQNWDNFEYSLKLKRGSWRGGPNPISQEIVFSNPSSNPTIPACVAQIEIPFPFFYCFFCHESQSQCTKSHFLASKKGKSQLPFYPFTTLWKGLLVSCSKCEWMKNTPRNEKKSREGPKTNNICSESLVLQYEVDYLAFGSFYTSLVSVR